MEKETASLHRYPVCGMDVAGADSDVSLTYGGTWEKMSISRRSSVIQ